MEAGGGMTLREGDWVARVRGGKVNEASTWFVWGSDGVRIELRNYGSVKVDSDEPRLLTLGQEEFRRSWRVVRANEHPDAPVALRLEVPV